MGANESTPTTSSDNEATPETDGYKVGIPDEEISEPEKPISSDDKPKFTSSKPVPTTERTAQFTILGVDRALSTYVEKQGRPPPAPPLALHVGNALLTDVDKKPLKRGLETDSKKRTTIRGLDERYPKWDGNFATWNDYVASLIKAAREVENGSDRDNANVIQKFYEPINNRDISETLRAKVWKLFRIKHEREFHHMVRLWYEDPIFHRQKDEKGQTLSFLKCEVYAIERLIYQMSPWFNVRNYNPATVVFLPSIGEVRTLVGFAAEEGKKARWKVDLKQANSKSEKTEIRKLKKNIEKKVKEINKENKGIIGLRRLTRGIKFPTYNDPLPLLGFDILDQKYMVKHFVKLFEKIAVALLGYLDDKGFEISNVGCFIAASVEASIAVKLEAGYMVGAMLNVDNNKIQRSSTPVWELGLDVIAFGFDFEAAYKGLFGIYLIPKKQVSENPNENLKGSALSISVSKYVGSNLSISMSLCEGKAGWILWGISLGLQSGMEIGYEVVGTFSEFIDHLYSRISPTYEDIKKHLENTSPSPRPGASGK